MNDEIVIKYKTETLSKDDFTERDRAVFNAGYNEGYAKAQKRPSEILAAVVGIGIIGLLMYQAF